MTTVERLQGTLNTLGLKAVEARLEGLLEQLLGCLRKYATLINHGSGTPITTLGYFRSLIDEIDQLNTSSDYWQYVAIRLTELERRWSRRGRDPEKTK